MEAARTYRCVVLFDKVLPRVVGSVTIDAAVLVLWGNGNKSDGGGSAARDMHGKRKSQHAELGKRQPPDKKILVTRPHPTSLSGNDHTCHREATAFIEGFRVAPTSRSYKIDPNHLGGSAYRGAAADTETEPCRNQRPTHGLLDYSCSPLMCIRSSRMSIMRVIWLNTRTRWPAAFSRVSSLSKRIICRAIGRSCKVPHAQSQKSGRKIERWECQTSSDIPSALQKHAGVKSQCLASPTHAFTENQSRRPACSLQPASRFIREAPE